MYIVLYSVHTVRNKWERESSPLNVSNKCWGGGGRVSLGRTSREDGVGEQPPTFIGYLMHVQVFGTHHLAKIELLDLLIYCVNLILFSSAFF